ncbi:MAG: hypothetical protein JO153_14370 [Solirubrobacterales bacterium]|nr:hypothetical protein [Solirubrobacterales bacterium]
MDGQASSPGTLPAIVAHADWSATPRKRWVASAYLAEGVYSMDAPRRVRAGGRILEQIGIDAAPGASALLGFDFPLGLPRAYARSARIDSFARWFRGLDPDSEFFAVAEQLSQVALQRPFFPARMRAKTPGIKSAFHARLGLTQPQSLRRCELAHCGRPAASEIFWTLGPRAVGKAALAGWRDCLLPALAEAPGRPKVALWPFEGRLHSLLTSSDVVAVEAYPAEAYLQLGLRIGSPRMTKTRASDRRADAARLLACCAQCAIRPSAALVGELETGFEAGAQGDDRFDAVVGLIAMIKVLRERTEPEVPDEPTIRDHEGWIFGQHVRCGGVAPTIAV